MDSAVGIGRAVHIILIIVACIINTMLQMANSASEGNREFPTLSIASSESTCASFFVGTLFASFLYRSSGGGRLVRVVWHV